MESQHAREVETGERFAFGENWQAFLSVLSEERIVSSQDCLKQMLGVENLENETFLDIGSGSGLSSLAAKRMGAKVFSFDFDRSSVACTEELKKRYFPNCQDWTVCEGSVLDPEFMTKLGKFSIVYSWGVLHHTGAMWVAIEHAISRVADGGKLFIAIYNDQGLKSHIWWLIKWFYNVLPKVLKKPYAYSVGFLAKFLNIAKYTLKLQPMVEIRSLFNYKKNRGMSILHDMVDWVGGFPFEFATYDTLENYMKSRGFELVKGKEATSLGCHQMIFLKK